MGLAAIIADDVAVDQERFGDLADDAQDPKIKKQKVNTTNNNVAGLSSADDENWYSDDSADEAAVRELKTLIKDTRQVSLRQDDRSRDAGLGPVAADSSAGQRFPQDRTPGLNGLGKGNCAFLVSVSHNQSGRV